jgi:glutaconate CoA-transferase subunit A
MMTDLIRDKLDELVAGIGAGDLIGVPPDYSGVAVAATMALIARGPRGLRLVATPTSGLQADLLIGAGALVEIECAAVTLGEHGLAPCFTRAVKAGALVLRDSTCPAIHAGLQAAEKGVPFMPLRGVIGSDLLDYRPDWRVIANPFAGPGDDDPILLLPAIRPDVALFHAPVADVHGNLFVGRRRELITLAHAARTTLATVERLVDGDLTRDETRAAGVLPALYVGGIAVAPNGAWPLACGQDYARDDGALADYARAAATETGFQAWLAAHGRRVAA